MSNESNTMMGTVNARYDVPDELMLPGMSQTVRKDVAILTHDNCRTLNIAKFADKPYRTCGTVRLLTLDDFKLFVQDRQGVPAPWVFVDKECVRAVFNMDGWQDDEACFQVFCTPEWTAWTEKDQKAMGQEAFCDFLEDHLKEIVCPSGSELLEMVANFRQMTRVEYGSSYRGSDGQIMLEYKERKEGAGGKDMALPAEFVLHLPVIKGAEEMTTYEVKARLRVRVDSDTHRLTLQYMLVRPDIPQDNAIADIVQHLREALPESRVFAGKVYSKPKEVLC